MLTVLCLGIHSSASPVDLLLVLKLNELQSLVVFLNTLELCFEQVQLLVLGLGNQSRVLLLLDPVKV
jgi:hypothetical protein